MWFDDDGRYQFHAECPADIGALIDTALREARDALINAGNTNVTWIAALAEVCNRSLGSIRSTSKSTTSSTGSRADQPTPSTSPRSAQKITEAPTSALTPPSATPTCRTAPFDDNATAQSSQPPEPDPTNQPATRTPTGHAYHHPSGETFRTKYWQLDNSPEQPQRLVTEAATSASAWATYHH